MTEHEESSSQRQVNQTSFNKYKDYNQQNNVPETKVNIKSFKIERRLDYDDMEQTNNGMNSHRMQQNLQDYGHHDRGYQQTHKFANSYFPVDEKLSLQGMRSKDHSHSQNAKDKNESNATKGKR